MKFKVFKGYPAMIPTWDDRWYPCKDYTYLEVHLGKAWCRTWAENDAVPLCIKYYKEMLRNHMTNRMITFYE